MCGGEEISVLMIPNFKNFRVGEVVRCVVKGVGERLVEGEIVYIHPTNGWIHPDEETGKRESYMGLYALQTARDLYGLDVVR